MNEGEIMEEIQKEILLQLKAIKIILAIMLGAIITIGLRM